MKILITMIAMCAATSYAADYTTTQTMTLAKDASITCSNVSSQFGVGGGQFVAAPADANTITVLHNGRSYYCSVKK